jgi:sec-independent protein translocase protein TatA
MEFAFLSPSPMELAVIAVIALLVLGPSRLPEAARSLGKGMREMRDSFQGGDDDDGPRYVDDDDDDDVAGLDDDADFDDPDADEETDVSAAGGEQAPARADAGDDGPPESEPAVKTA